MKYATTKILACMLAVSAVPAMAQKTASQGIDELARLIQIALCAVFAETALNSGGTHQVHGGRRDYFNCWYLGNIANLICYIFKLGQGASPFGFFLLG